MAKDTQKRRPSRIVPDASQASGVGSASPDGENAAQASAAVRREAEERNVGGRPPIEITDQMIRQIEVLAGYGLTEAAIAHVIGVDPRTFRRRKEDEERVLSALEKGKAVAEGVIGKALFQRAQAGDMTAVIWWERTRAGRREPKEADTTYEFDPDDFTDEGLRRVAAGESPVYVLASGGRASGGDGKAA